MKMWHLGACAAALAMTTALSTPGFAHEERRIPGRGGLVSMFIGFAQEPAWEDSINGIDVFLTSFNGFCPNGEDAIESAIDVRGTRGLADPDTVDLQVEALYLKEVSKPRGALGTLPPLGIVSRLKITDKSPLRQAFGASDQYNSRFRPTHPGNPTDGGAYGFRVYGTVHAGPKTVSCPGPFVPINLAPRTISVNHYFVCSRGGSLDTTPRSFNCVDPLQAFPGVPEDGYTPNAVPAAAAASKSSAPKAPEPDSPPRSLVKR